MLPEKQSIRYEVRKLKDLEFGKNLTERTITANGLSDSTFELLIDSSTLEHSHSSGPLGGAVKDWH